MTDELEVLDRLVDYHDHIAPPLVPVGDDVRRGRRRVRRNRGIVAGAVAVAVAGVIVTASLITGGGRDAAPPAVPSPTPSETPAKVQSAETWVDIAVAPHAGYGWDVPNPVDEARRAWFDLAEDHLDTSTPHLRGFTTSASGIEFERPPAGNIYPTTGQLGLVVDSGELNPIDGCRYLTGGPHPDNGFVSCSAERFTGPDGERARIARYQRLCETWDPGQPGDDARPGLGATYETCGDYRVAVAVERRDGLIGYVVVDGRGRPDANPFPRAALAEAAADRRLVLPEAAYAVPSDQQVKSVVTDHFADYRPDVLEQPLPVATGSAWTGGRLGPRALTVQVRLAGGLPTCGRSWLTECVERRVYGADDPTTVFVGSWDEEDWAADCCRPKNSRATSRVFVYVGPRHTVVVSEGLVVKAHEEAVGAELDPRVIDLLLDPRLQ